MKRTVQSLSLSLLTALLFSGSVSAAPALPLDPTDPAVQKVTDQASRMSETNQQVASYYQKSRYRTLDAVHSSEAKAEEGGLVFEVKEIRVTPSKFLSAEEIRRAIHFKGAGPATVKELTDMCASTVFMLMPSVDAMSLLRLPSRLLIRNTRRHIVGRLSISAHRRASRSLCSCRSVSSAGRLASDMSVYVALW